MQKWKMALGTLAIGAVTISPFVAGAAFAGAEKKTVKGDKPPAPTASEIETGQLLIKDKPVAKASTGGQPPAPTASEIETGQLLIKDKPVAKSSTGDKPTEPTAAEVETGQLLIKDKPVAKSSTGGQPPAPTAAEVETGQLLDKGPRWPHNVKAQSPNGGNTPLDAPAVDIETGQMLDKGPRPPIKASAADNDLCGLPYTPPCRSDASTAKKAPDKPKTSFRGSGVTTALLASAGAIGALVAFSGGNDGPTSP